MNPVTMSDRHWHLFLVAWFVIGAILIALSAMWIASKGLPNYHLTPSRTWNQTNLPTPTTVPYVPPDTTWM